MIEKRTKDMIHEALKSGGSITQDKGHDQKIIMALMILKCSLRNVCLVHMYLVVSRIKIKFSKELGTTQFIEEVINERNGKFFFDGEFVEGVEVKTHIPRALFLRYHYQRRIVGARTRTDKTHGEQFLNNFLNFIFWGKGMTIGMKIWRTNVGDKGNGMIMNTMGRRKSLWSGKKKLMFGEYGLEVLWHRGCLSGVNGMELHNNARITFFE
jgi:hypothetical protein